VEAQPARVAVPASQLILVAGLTLLAFVLRLDGFHDSLFGDELLLYRIVHDRGLGDVLQVVHDTEKTPPLHFVLAWASAKLGDPAVWLRLPSLVFGTATVPLVYMLGLRAVGPRAALLAASVFALDPFAIFYSAEARAYATITCLVALSTLALLVALDTRSRPWWAVYGVATLAAVYTHYIAVLVLATQVAWALWAHRDQRRELIVVNALVAVAYLPWIPSFLVQYDHSEAEAKRIFGAAPFSLERLGDIDLRAFMGHPYVPLDEVPGRLAVGVALVVILVATGVAATRFLRSSRRVRWSSRRLLMLLLALATPVGVALYSLQPETSFMLARNMSPSLPALTLVVGWLVVALGRRTGPIAAVVLVGAIAIGALRLLDQDYHRPPLREAADFVAARAGPHDPVINYFTWLQAPDVFDAHLAPRLPLSIPGEDDRIAWARARRTGRIFLVVPKTGPFGRLDRLGRAAGPGDRFDRVADRLYRGFTPILVGEYRYREPAGDR
jgi:mannosyltransferase